MKRKVLVAGILSSACILALVADPPQLTLTRDVQPILNKECSECHGAKSHKGKLDVSEGSAFKNLVNVPSDEVPTMMRVKPGEPEQSYLWLKVDHRAKEGSGMPKGVFYSKKLPQDQLDLIKNWIAQGAKE